MERVVINMDKFLNRSFLECPEKLSCSPIVAVTKAFVLRGPAAFLEVPDEMLEVLFNGGEDVLCEVAKALSCNEASSILEARVDLFKPMRIVKKRRLF